MPHFSVLLSGGEGGTRTPNLFTGNSFQDCVFIQPDPLLDSR